MHIVIKRIKIEIPRWFKHKLSGGDGGGGVCVCVCAIFAVHK
jgi:hypothetical protein